MVCLVFRGGRVVGQGVAPGSGWIFEALENHRQSLGVATCSAACRGPDSVLCG